MDESNLYGWGVSQYLPYSEIKWINQKQWKQFRYSNEFHELHSDYTLTSEKLHNMLSKYCSNIANKYDKKIGGVNKLVPKLDNMFSIIEIFSCICD